MYNIIVFYRQGVAEKPPTFETLMTKIHSIKSEKLMYILKRFFYSRTSFSFIKKRLIFCHENYAVVMLATIFNTQLQTMYEVVLHSP